MDFLIDFFKIPSVAAIIGAFAAFFLVYLTDLRRNRQKKKSLVHLIEINKRHAEGKLKTIQNKLKILKNYNKILPGPTLSFGINDIKRLESEVLDLLGIDEKQSLDAICYTMEAIDNLIKNIDNKIDKLVSLKADNLERDELVKTLPQDYEEVIVNLARVLDMASLYVNGQFKKILIKKYRREDYEDMVNLS